MANIQEKNQLIDTISAQLHQDEPNKPFRPSINSLQNRVILTEADWQQFKNLFEDVYPHFFSTLLARLYALFNANLNDAGFGLEQMMRELGMSRTTLFRKVIALTGLTAHELLHNYRLKQAAHLLRSGVSVGETAYQVGFESPAYFSKCFRDLYRVSPSEFVAQA